LFTLATTAPPGKEVRVTGIGPRLVKERREAWERWYRPVASARLSSAVWHSIAWATFGAGFVGAVVFVTSGIDGSTAEVLLLLSAGSRLSAYIAATVGEIGFLRGIWLDGSRRLAWLEDYAAESTRHEDLPAPTELREGIRVEALSFAYPGTEKLVLEDVSLEIPAGKVVAVVGENGAGKSTFVKLLCKLYEPTAGQILIDGQPLDRISGNEWRERLAGAFQDFFRFELKAKHSVAVGDSPRFEHHPAVLTAVGRAGAHDAVDKLHSGLETQLGPTWPDGAEVSFGQWQKFALARGFMRDEPLLLILDEPTAALDAETEHSLIEKYASAARGLDGPHPATNGRITILVSHRFSTVRMADLIVVLDGAHLAEFGTHEELMAKGGQYSELYGIQAQSYR
jgi:ATP-binding cassette subfamily B protein